MVAGLWYGPVLTDHLPGWALLQMTVAKNVFHLLFSGWNINGEEIEYDWVKGNLIVPKQLIYILCK